MRTWISFIRYESEDLFIFRDKECIDVRRSDLGKFEVSDYHSTNWCDRNRSDLSNISCKGKAL